MTVTSVDTDYDGLTVTLIAHFEASIDQVWDLWSDPRKLERWWGPPGYPATFEKHDLSPGGEVTYRMTGPEGEEHHGVWRVTAIDPPASLEFTDAFADSGGAPLEDSPVSVISVRLLEHEGGGARHGDPHDLRDPRGHGANRGDGHGRGVEAGRRSNGWPGRRVTAISNEPRFGGLHAQR